MKYLCWAPHRKETQVLVTNSYLPKYICTEARPPATSIRNADVSRPKALKRNKQLNKHKRHTHPVNAADTMGY